MNTGNRHEQASRRLMIVKIPNYFLTSLLSLDGSKAIKIIGLPADAKIIRVSSEVYFDQDVTAILFESEEFKPVISGCSIPELQLTSSWDETPTAFPTLGELVEKQKRGREFI